MKSNKLGLFRFVGAGVVVSLMAFWLLNTSQPMHGLAYALIIAMALIVGFQLYFGFKALKNERAGLTPDDELSIRIRDIAAAKAFRLSIFMWLFALLFIIDVLPIESVKLAKIVVAFGMVGMMLIFLITWFYLSRVGVPNEDQD